MNYCCSYPFCSEIVVDGLYCPIHKPKSKETRSEESKERNKGFNSRWQRFSQNFLANPRNKYCRYCGDKATVCGHSFEANEYFKEHKENILEASYYIPLCFKCNRLMRSRYGI